MGNFLSDRPQRGRSRGRSNVDDKQVEPTDGQGGLKGRLRRFSRSIGIRPKSKSTTTKMNTIRKVVQEQESKTSDQSPSLPVLETPTGDILIDLHHQETRNDDVELLSVIQECRSEEEVQSRDWNPHSRKTEVAGQPATDLDTSPSSAPWYNVCCGL